MALTMLKPCCPISLPRNLKSSPDTHCCLDGMMVSVLVGPTICFPPNCEKVAQKLTFKLLHEITGIGYTQSGRSTLVQPANE